MIASLFAVLASFASLASADNCSTVYSGPLSQNDIGYYQRIHPSGKYVLTSGSPVKIIDLTDLNNPKVLPTAANSEVYPVEPDWKLVASPNHPDGMRYYYFDNAEQGLLEKGTAAVAAFNDSQHNQYYHSVGTFESTDDSIKFRTVKYTSMSTREYSVKFDKAGNVTEHKESDIFTLCANLMRNNSSPEEVTRLQSQVEKTRQDLLAAQAANADQATLTGLLQAQRTANDQYRIGTQTTYSINTPIVSKDGKELLVSYKGGTHILKINDDGRNCEDVRTIPYQAGKGSWGYPVNGKNRYIAFTASASILPAEKRPPGVTGNVAFIYDMETDELKPLATDPGVVAQGFVGWTKENKVMFPVLTTEANQTRANKIAVSDPVHNEACGTTTPTTGVGATQGR